MIIIRKTKEVTSVEPHGVVSHMHMAAMYKAIKQRKKILFRILTPSAVMQM